MTTRKSALRPTGYAIDVFGRAVPVAYKAAGMAFCLDLCSLAAAIGVFPDELEASIGKPGMVDPEQVDARYLRYAVPKFCSTHPELDYTTLFSFASQLRDRSLDSGRRLYEAAFARAAEHSSALAHAYALRCQGAPAEDRRLMLAKPGEPYLELEVVAQSIYHQWLADAGVQRWLLNSFRDVPDPLPELPAVKDTWSH